MAKNLLYRLTFMSLLLSFAACKRSAPVSSGLTDVDGTQYVVDQTLGNAIASSALRGNQGYSSSACYNFVWNALRRVLGSKIDSTSVPSRSAYQFGDWIDRNSAQAVKVFRLKKIDVAGSDIPRGSVIVYSPAQCGAHPTHGHIEIAVGQGKACSDYCAPIRSCQPRVYVPIKPAEMGSEKSVAIDTSDDSELNDDSMNDSSEPSQDSDQIVSEQSRSVARPGIEIIGSQGTREMAKPTSGTIGQTTGNHTSPEIKPLSDVSKPEIQMRLKEAYALIKLYNSIQN